MPVTLSDVNVPTLVKKDVFTEDASVFSDSTSSLLILKTDPDFKLTPAEVILALVAITSPSRVFNINSPTLDPTLERTASILAIPIL